ncbi:hemin uptake protein HemP [Jiella avicenniae]|uniref:Hemin uptake protein HemP n=1 Tax=Jiella avicenniae TaxID=2907202 RepID=A0A9X1P5I8_9HYPH|nr:hemin uptake protein HemP [Jiella avicenniae]
MGDEAGRHDLEAPERTAPKAAEEGRPILSASSLLGDRREVEIHHGDAVYRLRLTRAGKLILTK